MNRPVRAPGLQGVGRVPRPGGLGPGNNAGRNRGFTSKRVSNRRLRQELGCTLRFRTFREGFAAELERLRVEPGAAASGEAGV